MFYLELKSVHIISVIAWFAGLFYIFRLYVYHRQNSDNNEVSKIFSMMERRLLCFIITPASILTLLSGAGLITLNPAYLEQKWLWLKIFFVALLLTYQFLSWFTYRRFLKGQFILSEKQCRCINEWPTLVLIVVVCLVVLKPW